VFLGDLRRLGRGGDRGEESRGKEKKRKKGKEGKEKEKGRRREGVDIPHHRDERRSTRIGLATRQATRNSIPPRGLPQLG
jgi:hypothetical protein